MRFRAIAIDGPSGAGKTACIALLAGLLARRSLSTTVASVHREGAFGELIASLANKKEDAVGAMLLIAAARAKALADHRATTVLFDRYFLSSLVCQGAADVPLDYIHAVNAPMLKGVLSICLSLSVEHLVQRRLNAQQTKTDWYKEHLTPEDEVARYAQAVVFSRRAGALVETIDASGSVLRTARRAAAVVLSRMAEAQGGER